MTWTILPASALPQHRAAWNELNRANGNSLLLDFDFVEAARVNFATGSEKLGIFEEDGAIKCMSLFTRRSPVVWQTFQPANAPLGFWITLQGMPLERTVRQLIRKLPGFALLFGITQQDPDILPRPSPSARLGLLDYIETPRLTVSGRFDDYWQSRGKNLRHNIQRQHNRLQREELAGRFEVVTDTTSMAACVADYADLESRGWKGRENSAVTAGDRQAAFYTVVLEHYATLGQASVWRYFLGDRLAASNLCVARDGVLYVLKTAYDESFKGLSPAQLMNHDAFRTIFDSGRLKRIEFYGPVKDWHTKWSGDRRTIYHINLYRGSWQKPLRDLLGSHRIS